MTDTNIRVSEKWKAIIERDACHTTLSEIAENIENALPEFEAHRVRLTESDRAKITQIAKKKHISFDDVFNYLIQTAFDVRFQYSKSAFKAELFDNMPDKMDIPRLTEEGKEEYRSHIVLFDRELLHKTCLIGRKRTNESNGEMPVKFSLIRDGERETFEFFIGSTIRLVLANYSFFENKQALIKASEIKHAE